MQLKVALSLALALLCCPAAIAQVPKFTVVTFTREPPGPIAPGGKFKLKVTVRNDGDTIPANRRFDFIFTSPDTVAIAPPTGTPALFFGYCPGGTPINMVCQCFAAWEKSQTVEMETEVTVGSSARGAVTVTFHVSSGAVSETASITVQIALAGPDLVPGIAASSIRTHIRGRLHSFRVLVTNIGTIPTHGAVFMKVELSAGLIHGRDSGGGTALWSDALGSLASGETSTALLSLGFSDLGVQWIGLTVSGGGDVNPSNNSKTVEFEVVREDPDPLNRLQETEKLAEILGR